MKSVLLHIQDDAGLEARLQAALALVRASEGHLSCLHITPAAAYTTFDGFGGPFVMGDIMTALRDQEEKMRAKLEERLSGEDVAWDYDQVTGDLAAQLAFRASINDLLVVSRERDSGSPAYPTVSLFGDILHAARTPILIQPIEQESYDPLGPVVVAWNGSFEAAIALRQTLQLLRMVSAVHIVTVEEAEASEFPSTSASAYLSRHGVNSEIHMVSGTGRTVPESILDTAAIQQASTIVMGAYGHSRAREYLFGGVTRTMLRDCPLPLILAR
jgi:nucleotide-binding universal stress UspA family protein